MRRDTGHGRRRDVRHAIDGSARLALFANAIRNG
jgi:hypothetical protein